MFDAQISSYKEMASLHIRGEQDGEPQYLDTSFK